MKTRCLSQWNSIVLEGYGQRIPDLSLNVDEIHVWRVGAPLPLRWLARGMSYLSGTERIRAGQYRYQADAERFISSRMALRLVLASYLNAEPASLAFNNDPFIKRQITNWSVPAPHFNLSHSGNLILIAVSQSWEIGVDVEKVTEDHPRQSVLECFFSQDYKTRLSALPEDEAREIFFQTWTFFEAYLKAKGIGLSEVTPGECIDLFEFDKKYAMVNLYLGKEYCGAVAVCGQPRIIRGFNLGLA